MCVDIIMNKKRFINAKVGTWNIITGHLLIFQCVVKQQTDYALMSRTISPMFGIVSQ